MGGEVRYSPSDVASFLWPIGDLRGLPFEREIIGQIDHDLAFARDQVRIIETKQTGDRGRDLIIESQIDFEIFGVKIVRGAREIVRVIIEIKSTDQARLSLKDFSSSISQRNRGDCDHYFLITNSTITPRAYYDAAGKLSVLGIRFHLIDQFTLAPALAKRSFHRIPVPDWPALNAAFVEYQVSKAVQNRERIVVLDICLRNFSDRDVLAQLTLQTDVGWTSNQPRLQRVIGPGQTIPIRFHAKSTTAAGVQDDIGIQVAFDQTRQEIRVRWRHSEESFVPLHWGARNQELVNDIAGVIDGCSNFAAVVLTGEAGAGKTRILEEVQLRRDSPGVTFHVGNFQFQDEDIAFQDVARSVEEARPLELEADDIPIDHDLSTLEGFADYVRTANLRKKLVLILEDAHYGAAEILQSLASLIREGRRVGEGGMVLIVTGRNDHSFVNRHFFAFLDEVQALEMVTHVHFAEIKALSDEDAKNLIRHSIEDCPAPALEKIHRMSMNIPFNIVQIIMYLMDKKFADVVNRDTVGITNLGRLHLAEKLPDSVRTILISRISSLSDTEHGELILKFLYCAGLYGLHVPQAIYDSFFDGHDLDTINDILTQRRLMHFPSGEGISWHHENILSIAKEMFAEDTNRRNLAQTFLSQRDLVDLLPPYERGLLAAVAERDDIALGFWKPILDQLGALNNISTSDLDQSCYYYIPELMKVFGRIARPLPDQIHACLGYAYIGVHHLPLPYGAEACRKAREMLDDAVHRLPEVTVEHASDANFASTCLKQLEARARVNMGMLRTADFLMAEVRYRMHLDDRTGGDQILSSEYHTTISDLYACFNHAELASGHLALLKNSAERLDNNNLRALHKIHFADLFRYTSPKKARELAEEAHAFAMSNGSSRHATLSGLGAIEVSLPLMRGDPAQLKDALDSATTYLENCTKKHYSSSVPRAQKLLATLHYLMADVDETYLSGALRHNGFALDAAVRYGDGLNIWRIYNDRAILMCRTGETQEATRQMLRSSIDHLMSCGLTFLGNGDFLKPNLIVLANYLKFLIKVSEREAFRFFNMLDWAGRHGQLSSQAASEMIRQAIKNHALLQKRRPPSIILDKVSNYALVC